MTPDQLSAWILPIALSLAVLVGVVTISVSLRTAWIMRSIAWATLWFGLLGAAVLLSPKWSQIAVEVGGFKANLARLEDEKRQLHAENARLSSQIETVSMLGKTKFGSAGEAVQTIEKTREAAAWADFLPGSRGAYRLEVLPGDPAFAAALGQALDVPPEKVSAAFEREGYTVLKKPTDRDLADSPATNLWIAPR